MTSTTGASRPLDYITKAHTVPFPWRKLIIVASCRICEPIAFMSIFPYVYYMIRFFEITSDTRQIAVYAGMVTSAFAFAEFLSGVAWGRISDRLGRKPVLIFGLAGTAVSMLVFGFAPNLPVALVGRALGGLLNGNQGVIATTVGEIVTVKEHQPLAYSIMPFAWCLGSILGPAIGGLLAQPCDSFPTLFPRGTLFDHFPFLLPNLVCAVILALGVAIGVLFLEETHEELSQRRDLGIEAGRWILDRFRNRIADQAIVDKAGEANVLEDCPLLEDEEPPGYRTTEGSPCSPSTPVRSPSTMPADVTMKGGKELKGKQRGVRKAFTKQVILNIVSVGLLAYHSISFDQLMPVFLSEPISTEPTALPFRFTGGFGFSSKTIGFMLSVQGIYAMLAQVLLFPLASRYFDNLRLYRWVLMTWPLLYILVPYLVLLPQRLRMPGIYLCLLWKITAQCFSFPSNAILLRNSAPSLLVLGMVNGASASTASLARALGPSVTGLIHSWGLEIGSTGVAWWACGLICLGGALESLWIKKVEDHVGHAEAGDEDGLADEALIDSLSIDAAISAAGNWSGSVEEGDDQIPKSHAEPSLF